MWVVDPEQHAARLGVRADYAGQVLLGAFMNDGLDLLLARGVPLPRSVVVESSRFEGRPSPPALLYAGFDPDNATVFVNPHSYYFGNVPSSAEQIARENFEIRYWSTDSPHHVLIHELGHELFARRDPIAYHGLRDTPLPEQARREIGSRICRRAEIGIGEFTAEVFAALVVGEFVPEEVLDWHRRLRGPEP